MVYRVSGNFTNENLNEFINKLQSKYNIVLRDENVYLALRDYNKEIEFSDKNDLSTMENSEDVMNRLTDELKTKVFIPLGDYFVKDLTRKSNIEHEDEFIQTWCKENVARIAKQIVEVENQAELRLMMNKLDELEVDLQQRAEEKVKEGKNNESIEENKGVETEPNDK